MIRLLFANLSIARRVGKSFSERVSIFSTLNRLYNKANRKGEPTAKISHEKFFQYDVQGYDSKNMYDLYRDVFIKQEYFFETSDSQPFIVDCGANIGTATLFFKKIFPDSKIICFEANPFVAERLRENVKNNNLTGVEIHNLALTDKEGEQISFYISDNPGTLAGSINPNRSGTNEIKCATTKLSKHIARIPKVNLLKMDVEGAEWLIVKDLTEASMFNKIEQIIVEYHHLIAGEKSRLSEFLKIFEDHGYEYNLKSGYKRIGQFQDVLIHFYKR